MAKVLLLTGSAQRGSLGVSYFNAFKKLEVSADILNVSELYSKNRLARNRYFHRLGWRFFAGLIQKDIIRKTVEVSPDMVIIFKGMYVKPETVKEIKKRLPNTVVCNYNPDNPFNTWSHGAANSWVRKSIPLYDIYFTWGKFLMDPIKEAGAKRVEYLPFGYDSDMHYPVDLTEEERQKYSADVSFIGGWDKEREEVLNYLLDFNFKLWGTTWNRANKVLASKWTKEAPREEDFSKVVKASKININILRRQNKTAHNMRTFEIPACEGFMLAERTPEHQELFTEGKEADYFSSPEELKQKISFYLKNDELRKKIAEAGYNKLINTGYSYKNRAEQILKTSSPI